MPNALHRVHKAHLTFTAVFPCRQLAHIEPSIHQNPQAESPYPVLTCSSSPPTLPLSHPLSIPSPIPSPSAIRSVARGAS